MPLEPDDLRHLRAAEGYLELGMPLDANERLEKIDAEVRHVPEVLAARHEIYRTLEKWELMQTVSAKLAEHEPDEPKWWISLAYATRRAQSIEHAKPILLEAVARHPKEAMIHFNLACYDCQLGDIRAAKAHLARAFEFAPQLRKIALEDTDLEPLWASMGPDPKQRGDGD